MKTKFWLVSLVVIVAILLSACTINITTKVNADGSGELGAIYKFTEADLKSLSDMGSPTEDLCTSMTSSGGAPSDMTFTQEKHGTETWCVATKQVKTLDELKKELGGDGFTINTLEIKDGKFTFDADVDMSQGSSSTSGMGMISIVYEFTAPGKVTKTNGDQKGNVVTWDLPMDKTINLHLESNVGGSSVLDLGNINLTDYWYVAVLCCCCLLVVVIIVVVLVVMQRRKKSAPAM